MFKPEIVIDGKRIGPQHPTYIIAEMSTNHAQDIGKAKELVYAAKESGADAIKLQTYRADTLTMKCDKPHFYIQKGPWKGQYMYDLYEKAYMPWSFHAELFELARKLNITCFSSPFDNTAVDLLAELDAPAYKIASPELIDHELVRYIASKKKPIILSTGGASLTEICEVVDILKECQVDELCLLKCTSTYPAPPNSINLRTIPHMHETFKCPIGLSDHTLGIHNKLCCSWCLRD
jgi:sialic acid synthase SpsE